jgi:D-glycero-D-manno-heptose 1,7-bisphosphate phosphatase
MENILIKALILDRDGTLIEHVPYLDDPAEVNLLPGVVDGLKAAIDSGILLFLHSNQSGVGRGMFDLEAAEACNARMIDLLGLGKAVFSRICLAPEAPEDPAIYRKPSPRFAFEIIRDFELSPDQICYVGDRWSDLATATAAGTRAVGVATGLDDLREEIREHGLQDSYPVCDSFLAAMALILGKSC